MNFDSMSCDELVTFINDEGNALADRQTAYALWEGRCAATQGAPNQSGNNGPAPIRPH